MQSTHLLFRFEQIKNFFYEKEQDSLLLHIFRQAILISPCVLSVLPFINIYDRRFKMSKIPIASTIIGVAACALGGLKKRQKTIESKEELNSEDKIRIETNRFIRNFIWKTICYNTTDVLIHELGHYVAVRALLNVPAAIEIFPGGGGVTKIGKLFENVFAKKRPWVGKKIDRKTIEAIIAAAGPGFQTIHICAKLFSAFLLKKSHPEASNVLRSLAMQNTARLCGYSLGEIEIVTNPNILTMFNVAGNFFPLFSLIVSPKTGDVVSDVCLFANQALLPQAGIGDFSILRNYGIHPLRCLLISLAIPLAFQLSLIGYTTRD